MPLSEAQWEIAGWCPHCEEIIWCMEEETFQTKCECGEEIELWKSTL